MNKKTELEALNHYWKLHQKHTKETQQTAAEKINIQQAAFCQYLKGQTKLNAQFLLKMCRMMGVNPAEIRPSMAVIFSSLKGKRLADKLDGTIEALNGSN